MAMFAGLDVSLKATVICVVDSPGRVVWRGSVASRPAEIAKALEPWRDRLKLVGLETGSLSPFLYHGLMELGFATVCMDARRAADALKARRVKSDEVDARALAEMLRTGWYSAVHVKSLDSHRVKAVLGARDQLVRAKRSLGNQVRGLLRPFGIRLASRQGTKRFVIAVEEAVQDDPVLRLAVRALLESLAAIESEIAKLDEALLEIARRSEVCWRLMSVPGVGPITALAFMATIDEVGRFTRMRDIGAYLGLTPRRYQSGDRDVSLGISRQGDGMARHYLYEAAGVLLSTVRRRSALKSWGLGLRKRLGAKRARVAVARKLAVLLGRIWRDGTHFEAQAA